MARYDRTVQRELARLQSLEKLRRKYPQESLAGGGLFRRGAPEVPSVEIVKGGVNPFGDPVGFGFQQPALTTATQTEVFGPETIGRGKRIFEEEAAKRTEARITPIRQEAIDKGELTFFNPITGNDEPVKITPQEEYLKDLKDKGFFGAFFAGGAEDSPAERRREEFAQIGGVVGFANTPIEQLGGITPAEIAGIGVIAYAGIQAVKIGWQAFISSQLNRTLNQMAQNKDVSSAEVQVLRTQMMNSTEVRQWLNRQVWRNVKGKFKINPESVKQAGEDITALVQRGTSNLVSRGTQTGALAFGGKTPPPIVPPTGGVPVVPEGVSQQPSVTRGQAQLAKKQEITADLSGIAEESTNNLLGDIINLPTDMRNTFDDMLVFLNEYAQLSTQGTAFTDTKVDALFEKIQGISSGDPMFTGSAFKARNDEALANPTRANKVIAIDALVSVAHNRGSMLPLLLGKPIPRVEGRGIGSARERVIQDITEDVNSVLDEIREPRVTPTTQPEVTPARTPEEIDAALRRAEEIRTAREAQLRYGVNPQEVTGAEFVKAGLASHRKALGGTGFPLNIREQTRILKEEYKTLTTQPEVTPPVTEGVTAEQLPLLPPGEAAAKQAIEAQLYEPIADSPLDLPSTTYRKSGNFDDYIENMPTFTKLTSGDIQGQQQMFKDFPGIEPSDVGLRLLKSGKLSPAMRKSGFYVNTEFVSYDKFVDVSLPSGTSQDPTRMMQNIQGGFGVGPLTKYVLYPTRSTQLASLNYSDSEKYLYRGVMEKYSMVGDKKARRLAGDVIEYINRNEIEVNPQEILAKPEVATILAKSSPVDKIRIIQYAQESRLTFDKLIGSQNQARAKRNQDEIEYRNNYRPWVTETNIWGKLMGQRQKPEVTMRSPVLPDYIKPDAPFNPRAMSRDGGMGDYLKERDLQKLTYDYIDVASKDIFNTNIVHNAKIHAATLRSMGYPSSATLVENWAAEAYTGVPPPVTRTVRTLAPPSVIKPGLWLRRRLTSAVFPLNFTWNALVQTSSGALTMMRYGVVNSLKGLDYLFNSQAKQDIRTNAYSLIIKQREAGKVAYQDVGSTTAKVRELEASPIETVEHYLNFLTNVLEEKLTGVSVRAAYHDGQKKGYTGRELWEYASEGGAKTQSMYNMEDLPGVLRAKEVGALAPFQTFAFEVFNTARELNIIGVRKVVGRAGAYESTSAKSPTGKATISNRLKMLATWIASMVVINLYVDKIINRKPWSISSFVPFFAVLTGGVNAGNPWNMLLPLKYTADLKSGIDAVIKYGNFKKLRKWALQYHAPAGVQLNRVIEGIEAVSAGEVSSVSGKKMFDVKPEEAWKAILMGVYTTEGGREYIDRLQESEGGLFKELTGVSIPKIPEGEADIPSGAPQRKSRGTVPSSSAPQRKVR